MEKEFQVGDVAALNSGGPNMTVVAVVLGTENPGIRLIWMDKTDRGQTVYLPPTCLRRVATGSHV